MSSWSRGDLIALCSLIITIITAAIGVINPELRCLVGLESESCLLSPQGIKNPPKYSKKLVKETEPDNLTNRIDKLQKRIDEVLNN